VTGKLINRPTRSLKEMHDLSGLTSKMHVQSAIPIVVFGLALFLIARTVDSLVNRRRREQLFANVYGCRPAPGGIAPRDKLWGIDLFLERIKDGLNRQYLTGSQGRYNRFGNTYVSRNLNKEIIHTCEPENVRQILLAQFNDFAMPKLRVQTMLPFWGYGIFTTNGKRWEHSRNLLRPCFTSRSIGSTVSSMERHFQIMLEHIPLDGSMVDIQALFLSYALHTGNEFLLGESVTTQSSPNLGRVSNEEFAEAFAAVGLESAKMGALGPIQWMRHSFSAHRAKLVAWKWVDQLIDDAFERKDQALKSINSEVEPKKYVFLDELVKTTTDRKLIREEILNILIASRDTTASLLGNLFFMLARHPDIWAKLRAEILTIGNELPKIEELQRLTYLRYCINECKMSQSPTFTIC
jgi:cytochrome P450